MQTKIQSYPLQSFKYMSFLCGNPNYLIKIFHLQVITPQNYQNTNKVKHSFYLNLKFRNLKYLFGQKNNIQKLNLMGPPPSKRIYT